MIGFDDPEYNPDGPNALNGDLSTASVEMFMYAEKLKERYKNSSEQNLATALLNAEVDGHKLSEIEFNSFFMLLAVAGNEAIRRLDNFAYGGTNSHSRIQQPLAQRRIINLGSMPWIEW